MPLPDLSVHGSPVFEPVDLDALASVPVPASYAEYIRRYGWARLFGLWLVYPPVLPGWADGLGNRGALLTARAHDTFVTARVEGFDWAIEPDGSWELVPRLTVFAASENAAYLMWDGTGAVWHSVRFDSLTRLGDSFDAAVPRLRSMSEPFASRAPADVEPLAGSRL